MHDRKLSELCFGSFIVIAIPGSTVLLAIHYAIRYGKPATLPLIASIMLADLLAMTICFVGVGAILYSSAMLFTVLKILGSIYLMYLGISLWRSAEKTANEIPQISRKAVF